MATVLPCLHTSLIISRRSTRCPVDHGDWYPEASGCRRHAPAPLRKIQLVEEVQRRCKMKATTLQDEVRFFSSTPSCPNFLVCSKSEIVAWLRNNPIDSDADLRFVVSTLQSTTYGLAPHQCPLAHTSAPSLRDARFMANPSKGQSHRMFETLCGAFMERK